MKIREGFVLRDVGEKTFVVAVGDLSKEFRGMITLNRTGKEMWQMLEGGADEKQIVEKFVELYGEENREQIAQDVSAFVKKLGEDNILAE